MLYWGGLTTPFFYAKNYSNIAKLYGSHRGCSLDCTCTKEWCTWVGNNTAINSNTSVNFMSDIAHMVWMVVMIIFLTTVPAAIVMSVTLKVLGVKDKV